MIRVLVVDGCRQRRELLRSVFERDPAFVVSGTADGVDSALERIARDAPQIVVVGHRLPESDGRAITAAIMETNPLPVVVVAAATGAGEVASGFDAVESGALAVVPGPSGDGDKAEASAVRELLNTVRVMSEVRVVRRWRRHRAAVAAAATGDARRRSPLVAIGASTGGPIALATLLRALPKDFPAPVVVVQHMATGFTRGFVDWLAPSSALPVHVAASGEHLLSGHVYVAPDSLQMRVTRHRTVALDAAEPENGLRPSVSYLFRSITESCGSDGIAVLLTGMGRDGAKELKQLRDAGGVTFAQDEASSVVFGMPGEAVRLGAASQVLPPLGIAEALVRSVARQGSAR